MAICDIEQGFGTAFGQCTGVVGLRICIEETPWSQRLGPGQTRSLLRWQGADLGHLATGSLSEHPEGPLHAADQ